MTLEAAALTLFEMFNAMTVDAVAALEVKVLQRLMVLGSFVFTLRLKEARAIVSSMPHMKDARKICTKSADGAIHGMCQLLTAVLESRADDGDFTACAVRAQICNSLVPLLALESDPIANMDVLVSVAELMSSVVYLVDPANDEEVGSVLDIPQQPVQVLLQLLASSQSEGTQCDQLSEMASKCVQIMSDWIGPRTSERADLFLQADCMSILCNSLLRSVEGTEQRLTLTWAVINIMSAQDDEECIAWLRRGVAPFLCEFPELFRRQQVSDDDDCSEDIVEITADIIRKTLKLLDQCKSSGSAHFREAAGNCASYAKAKLFAVKFLKEAVKN